MEDSKISSPVCLRFSGWVPKSAADARRWSFQSANTLHLTDAWVIYKHVHIWNDDHTKKERQDRLIVYLYRFIIGLETQLTQDPKRGQERERIRLSGQTFDYLFHLALLDVDGILDAGFHLSMEPVSIFRNHFWIVDKKIWIESKTEEWAREGTSRALTVEPFGLYARHFDVRILLDDLGDQLTCCWSGVVES